MLGALGRAGGREWEMGSSNIAYRYEILKIQITYM